MYNERVVQRYLRKYKDLVLYHKLCQRQYRLERAIIPGYPLTPEQQQEAEAINALKTKCMLAAEKQCRKLHMGEVQFSDKLAEVVKQIAF